MYEWIENAGPFSACLVVFISFFLASAIASRLQILVAPWQPMKSPFDLGLLVLGVWIYVASMPQLIRFFIDFDPSHLALWLLGLFGGAPLAFAIGWGYGKWFKFSTASGLSRGGARIDEHLVASESTAKDDGISGQASEPLREAAALCAAFIGSKESQYYLSQFERLAGEEPNKKPIVRVFPAFRYTTTSLARTWNWSSFLLSYAWALYRKLYGWSAALFAASFVCFMAIGEGTRALGLVSLVATWAVFATYANALYYAKAKEAISEARRSADSEEQIIAKVRDKGGVEGWASLVGVGHVLFGVPALLMALAEPQQPTVQANLSKQALTPSSDEMVDAIAPTQEQSLADSNLGTNASGVVGSDSHIRNLYDAGRFSELVKFVEQHVSENPNDTLAVNYAGLAWMGMGNKGEARVWFQRAIELNPESPTLYYNLTSTYDLRYDYKKIIEILGAAQQIDSNNTLVNDALNSAQRFAQQVEAERAAQAPIRIQPGVDSQTEDDSDCQVKPVMTDEEIRRWRKCSERR